jgi:hypothetical protein
MMPHTLRINNKPKKIIDVRDIILTILIFIVIGI